MTTAETTPETTPHLRLAPAGGVERTLEMAGLAIGWDERVLEPRPWTVMQAWWAAELLAAETGGGRVLELCSGAGHIGLAAASLSGRRLVSVDVDPEAARRTADNARRNDLAGRVEVRLGRLQEVLDEGERFALVLADPPWVRRDAVAGFPADPVLAIDGGDDGLDLARDCVTATRGHLDPGGSLLVQLGDRAQADALATWAAADGWCEAGLRTGRHGASRGVVLRLLHPA